MSKKLEKLDDYTNRCTQKAWQILVVESQMLGEIIASLKWRIGDDNCETIGVNGRTLSINPEWWKNKLLKERIFLLAHEATHFVQMAWDKRRIKKKHSDEPKRMNRALDYAANGVLEKDPNVGKYLTRALKEAGCFPSQLPTYCRDQSFEAMFEHIGPQEDEEDPQDSQGENNEDGDGDMDSDDAQRASSPANGDQDEDGDEESEVDGAGDQQNTEDILNRIRERGDQDKLSESIRKTIVSKDDAKCVENWREILRDFLWKKTRDKKSYKRPSRRWDGKGAVLPGRSSRDFPKTALILDFSRSMSNYIKACAESLVHLMVDVSGGEVYVIACSNRIVYEWMILRNSKVPTKEEILAEFYGGGTHMMPGILAARAWGAEVILCVSDMETSQEDLECGDVTWITAKNNPIIKQWRDYRDLPKGRVFDVLYV